MRRTHITHGFTLIEILVSVTLLLVLSGLMIANYNGFNDAQVVKQAASSMRSNMQAARTRAASGVKPTPCDQLVGYQVDFTASTYKVSALCVVSGSEQLVGDTTYTLPTGVTFAEVPLSTIFYALNRGASVSQTITLSGNDKTASVFIRESGAIN
jgi:prepilin-type N-terminal cleavage/methylation domain-containing protein